MTNMVRCRLCGRLILMMDAPGGKRMPCETTMVRFVPDLNGSNKYLTDDMVTIRGVEPMPGDRDVHMGYIDHRSVCPARAGEKRSNHKDEKHVLHIQPG